MDEPDRMAIVLPPEVSRILHVTNLPAVINGEKLYGIFEGFGRLRQIRVGNAPETKGTALVVFEDIYDAKSAVDKMDHYKITSTRAMRVQYFDLEKHKKETDRTKRRREQVADFQRNVVANAKLAAQLADADQAAAAA